MDALAKLKRDLTKQYGEDSVLFAAEMPDFEIVSSGSLALDFATGISGLPHNRVIEIVGPEGVGKTSLAFLMIKSFLKNYPDKGVVVCDLEHRVTKSWMESLIGSEFLERVILLWPDSAEDATDMFKETVKSGLVSLFLYDSIGGSPSQRVTDKSATIGNIGGNAQAMTRFSQFAAIYSHKYGTLTVCVNQIRDDISGYNRLITPGGHGLKHAYSLRIWLKPGKDKFYDMIDGDKVQVGSVITAKIIKNSLAAPYKSSNYIFYHTPCKYGFGIDTIEETIRLGILTDVVHKAGRWFNHPLLPGGQVGSSADLLEVIRSDENIRDAIVKEIMTSLGERKVSGVTTTFDPDDIDDGIEEKLSTIGTIYTAED
jgi:recombination protein RecA